MNFHFWKLDPSHDIRLSLVTSDVISSGDLRAVSTIKKSLRWCKAFSQSFIQKEFINSWFSGHRRNETARVSLITVFRENSAQWHTHFYYPWVNIPGFVWLQQVFVLHSLYFCSLRPYNLPSRC